MAPAISDNPTVNQLLKALGIEVNATNVNKVAQVLDRDKVSKTVKIPAAKVDEVKAIFAEPSSTNGNGTSGDKPEESKPEARKTSGAVARQDRNRRLGAFGRVVNPSSKRLELSMEDGNILYRLQKMLDGMHAIAAAPDRRKLLKRPGQVGLNDVAYPKDRNRIIWLDLAVYWDAKEKGQVPLLHIKTKRELAKPLGELSFAKHECELCGNELHLGLVRKLELLLAGEIKLPFDPNARDVVKFRTWHRRCSAILNMMVEVELEAAIQAMPEGSAKDAARVNRYIARLGENDKALWVQFMDFEHEGAISARDVVALIKTIHQTILNQKEELV